MVVREAGHAEDRGTAFKEVRVEFNYDPIQKRFRDLAIVRDEAIWGRGSTYTLRSPLIKTEKRALSVAEAVLANLQRYSGMLAEDEIPHAREIAISFDDDRGEFFRRLDILAEQWENSTLTRNRWKIPAAART
jgi:hypothetical protein